MFQVKLGLLKSIWVAYDGFWTMLEVICGAVLKTMCEISQQKARERCVIPFLDSRLILSLISHCYCHVVGAFFFFKAVNLWTRSDDT